MGLRFGQPALLLALSREIFERGAAPYRSS